MSPSARRLTLILLGLLLFCSLAEGTTLLSLGQKTKNFQERYRLVVQEQDRDIAPDLQEMVRTGFDRVEEFFGTPFKREFVFEIHSNRDEFDQYLKRRWNVPQSQRWMVASGVADRLTMISPRVWDTEADEHDPSNTDHIRELLAHELVHVYHGQFCPRPDFEGMDELGWFIEGLAVYVSGQLSNSHMGAAREAIQSGKAPTKLTEAWSGRYRYGVSGSMVEFIVAQHGKAMLSKLLRVTNNADALELLSTSEVDFIDSWKKHVLKQNE